jgi:hypothetical protein
MKTFLGCEYFMELDYFSLPKAKHAAAGKR